MKYQKMMTIGLIAISATLVACGKREETPKELQERLVYENFKVVQEEMKNKVPKTEIVGKIQGREILIHKFYDEKNGASCYFIDYNLNNLSCVK